jgi:tetratricopeptide (TPR) repeat protein
MANSKFEKAINMYENSLKKFYDFKNLELILLISRCYFELKNYNDSLMILEKGLEVDSENSILNFDLGI